MIKIIDMNNLRKLKKKKITKILNPEQIAQQKLFEISHQQDEDEAIQDPDIFLQNLQSKPAPPTQPKIKKRQRSVGPLGQKKNRGFGSFSLSELQERSHDFVHRHPISITNYLIIDDRYPAVKSEPREKSPRIDCTTIIRRRAAISKSKAKTTQFQVKSMELNTSHQSGGIIKQKVNGMVNAIKIKNIKLYCKYPNFFAH